MPKRPLLLLLPLLLPAACTDRRPAPAPRWRLDVERMKEQKLAALPPAVRQGLAIPGQEHPLLQGYRNMRGTLELHPDGTFRRTLAAPPLIAERTVTGRWRWRGETLELTDAGERPTVRAFALREGRLHSLPGADTTLRSLVYAPIR